jgi:hypothetical protein
MKKLLIIFLLLFAVQSFAFPPIFSSSGYTSADLGVTLQPYDANTVISSGTHTANQLMCWSADTLSAVSCGAQIVTGAGVDTAAAIAINTAGGFNTKGGVADKIATFFWDGGASAMTNGATTKRCVQVPFAATITGVYIKASTSSTLTITPYKDVFATGALATTALISGAGTTGVTSTLGVHDTTLTGWTTAVSAGDEICAQITSNNNALWISMQIHGLR